MGNRRVEDSSTDGKETMNTFSLNPWWNTKRRIEGSIVLSFLDTLIDPLRVPEKSVKEEDQVYWN